MTVLVTAEMFIKPERVDEFLQLLQAALPETRAYKGCEGLDTFVNKDDEGHIFFVERWAERADHETYLQWRTEQGMFDVLADFASAPPKVHYFDPRPEI